MGRNFNADDAIARLTAFVRDFAASNGFPHVVIGLSGGVDSSVSAALGVRALGSDDVLGLIMPYRSSSPESEGHALDVARLLGIATEKVDLTPMIDAYFDSREVSQVRRGNKLARERMAVLFDIASRDRRLVLGTSNKTEICLGYSTWYGDSACSLNPLGGLYKRDVREIARRLGVPDSIIAKKPTADLWPGQTDEGELGVSYDLADRVLNEIVEKGERSQVKISAAAGADEQVVRKIVDRLNGFLYKRSLPATDLLGRRPIPETVVLIDG